MNHGDRTAAALDEAQDRAGLGRDNTVSLYRRNLLTIVVWNASAKQPESDQAGKIDQFQLLKAKS